MKFLFTKLQWLFLSQLNQYQLSLSLLFKTDLGCKSRFPYRWPWIGCVGPIKTKVFSRKTGAPALSQIETNPFKRRQSSQLRLLVLEQKGYKLLVTSSAQVSSPLYARFSSTKQAHVMVNFVYRLGWAKGMPASLVNISGHDCEGVYGREKHAPQHRWASSDTWRT